MISQQDVPESWNIKQLGDICEVINGDRGSEYPSSSDLVEDGIPFIKIKHTNGEEISWEEVDYITQEKFNKLSRGKLQNNDVIMCIRGSVGNFAVFRETTEYKTGFIRSTSCILRPEDTVLHNYFKNYLHSPYFQRQAQELATGATHPNLSAKNLKKIEVPVPPLDEQERIVEAVEERLGRVERLEKSVENVGRLADEYQDSYTISLFAGLDNKSESVDVQSLSQSIPEDWEMKNFGDVVESSLYGCNPDTGENIDGVPYLRISDIREDGGLKYKELPESARFEKDSDANKYGLKDGDIVIARSGASCGQSYVYQQKHGDIVYASYLIRFRLNKDLVDKEYIRAYLSSPLYWEQVDSAKKGAAQNNINAGSIKDFKIPIPPLEKQKEIVESLKSIDYSEIQRASNDLEGLFKEYRNSILKNTFQGDINY